MDGLYIDFRKMRRSGYGGPVVAAAAAAAVIALCYVLFHDPYAELHGQIFETATSIRMYYADRPGYWKLDTESASNDLLIAKGLRKYKNQLKIGIGAEGRTAMPSDTNFDITLTGLNKSSCIGLTEEKISSDRQLELQKITVINANGTTEFTWGDKDHPLPVEKYAARKICTSAGNTVLWTFY